MGLDYTGNDKTELDQKLNDAVLDVLRRTRCYVASGTTTLTAGTTDYTLDTGILEIVSLYSTSAGSNYSFEPLSLGEITDLQVRNSTQNSPSYYYSLAGANLLTVWPVPSSADTLTFRYVPRPTAMSTSGNDPSTATYGGIPAEYHYGLELYALWKMADSTDDESSGQGERYRLMYEGQDGRGGFLGQIRAETNRKSGRLGRARVNFRRAGRVRGNHPSTDLY